MFIIAIVAIILVVIFCIRRSQLRRAYPLTSSRVSSQGTGTVEVLVIVWPSGIPYGRPLYDQHALPPHVYQLFDALNHYLFHIWSS